MGASKEGIAVGTAVVEGNAAEGATSIPEGLTAVTSGSLTYFTTANLLLCFWTPADAPKPEVVDPLLCAKPLPILPTVSDSEFIKIAASPPLSLTIAAISFSRLAILAIPIKPLLCGIMGELQLSAGGACLCHRNAQSKPVTQALENVKRKGKHRHWGGAID